MATTTAVQDPTFLGLDQTTTEILGIGIQTGVGAIAGLVFGIVNPVGGAIFAATSSIARMVGRHIINALPIEENIAKTALRVSSFILSISLGIIATAYAGFTMTTFAALGMTFIVLSATMLISAGAVINRAIEEART